jgi:hypothetical protein
MDPLALRPLSTGEILDVAFSLYRRHFVPLATIAVIVQGVPIVLQVYAEGQGGLTGNLSVYFLSLLVSTIGAAIGMAASMHLIGDSYLGRQVAAREALLRAVPFAGRLVMLSIGASLLIGLGLFLLIVPGIIVACGLGVAPQALVLENLPNAGAAMNRSWNLTRGFRAKVFFTYLVVMILVYLSSAAAVLAAGFAFSWSGGGTGYLIGVLLFSGLFSVLVYPYFYCAATVLYYDLRVRKEGFDLEMLEQAIEAA